LIDLTLAAANVACASPDRATEPSCATGSETDISQAANRPLDLLLFLVNIHEPQDHQLLPKPVDKRCCSKVLAHIP
jgi:hypothetical protein